MSRHYGSTSERGYGSPHQKLKEWWRPHVDAGAVRCFAAICLEERDGKSRWILPGTPWHLGHTPDRSGWTGPEHARCGSSDGATRGNRQRPRIIVAALGPGRSPLCKACGKEYHYAAKDCIICGRHYHPSRKVQYTCSRACGLAYRRLGGYTAKPPPACEICGKPCASRNARTCGSDTCMRKHRESQRTERACEFCGVKFVALTAKFCSENCAVLKRYYEERSTVAPTRTVAQSAAWQAHKNKTGTSAVRQSRTW